MGLERFIRSSQEVIQHPEAEQIIKDFMLKAEVVDGFVNHTYILNKILESLQKKSSASFISRVPVTTTIGGLKDGLMDEIIQEKDLTPEEIENKIFSVDKEDTKDDDEDIKEDETKENNPSENLEWVNDFETFFKNQNSKYQCRKGFAKNKLIIEDGHHKIMYQNQNRALVSIDKENSNNKLFEDMIALAKQQGINDIKLEDTLDLDSKLRLYAACQKQGMKIQNFLYNPKMLEKAGSETKKIINAVQNNSAVAYTRKENQSR